VEGKQQKQIESMKKSRATFSVSWHEQHGNICEQGTCKDVSDLSIKEMGGARTDVSKYNNFIFRIRESKENFLGVLDSEETW